MDDRTTYERVPLTELRDKAGLGRVGDRVADTGTPVVVTRQGRAHFLIAPLAMLRPDALPDSYFDAEQRDRDQQSLLGDLAARFEPGTVAEAMAWAENLDDDTGPVRGTGGPNAA